MDHDQAQLAVHAGELTEAVIQAADDCNGWVLLLTDRAGGHHALTGHTGTRKVYRSLDQATETARELGFRAIRVEEAF